MNQIRNHYKIVTIFSVLCLLLTGCGNKESAAQGETTDIFGSYTISPSGALKNNGNGYLLFYDKESDSTVYLCNRAGCRHIDHTCGAYFEGMILPFFFDSYLYIVASTLTEDCQIFRADRYGENRELLQTISRPVLQIEIVGNELYFFGVIMEDAEEESTSRQSVGQLLCRLNLDTGDYKEFSNIATGYPNANPGHFTVTNNFFYISYNSSSIDFSKLFDSDTGKLKDIAWDEIVYTDLVYRMNRDTEEMELIYTREKTGGNTFSVSVLEENEYSLTLFSPDRIWEYDLRTGEETILYEPIEEMEEVSKIGTHYLICNYSEKNFILLKDWQEAASFSGLDYEVDSYFGMSGDSVYFGRNGNLCAIKYEDLVNGNYDFRIVMSER
ncbi:MAG: hypothetical protein HDR15_15540 [Lachnospiraceae bacterium]|nr:hypothetical protein [Lachnospiraceae bacterium]